MALYGNISYASFLRASVTDEMLNNPLLLRRENCEQMMNRTVSDGELNELLASSLNDELPYIDILSNLSQIIREQAGYTTQDRNHAGIIEAFYAAHRFNIALTLIIIIPHDNFASRNITRSGPITMRPQQPDREIKLVLTTSSPDSENPNHFVLSSGSIIRNPQVSQGINKANVASLDIISEILIFLLSVERMGL